MNKYELVLVVSPLLDEEGTEAAIAKVEALIKKNSGEIENNERWGKRRLAYEIKDQTEGYYSVVTFAAQADVIKELDRVLKISDDILRHMIIRLED